jgi:lipopolysaccharide transport system permease protein/teichoic acid transport system permease protein
MIKYLKELARRRDLMLYLVISGLKSQHKNSFLGYFWWLLDPLLGTLIYYFVVVVVFDRGGGADFGIYLVVGMIVWRSISSTLTAAGRSIVSKSNIITQVYLPKANLPIGAAVTQLVNFGFGLVVIAIFFIVLRVVPGITILWLPFIIVTQFFFMTAIALPVAYLSVFLRDMDNIVSHLTRLWFFGSPVIWRVEMIPERVRWLIDINPMAYFLNSYRQALIYKNPPDVPALLIIGFFSLLISVAMIYCYSRYEHKMIKVL